MTSKAILFGVLFSACGASRTSEPPAQHIDPLPSPPAAAPVQSAATPPAPPSRVLADGLEIQDLRVGTGDELTPGSTAVVEYVGTLPDGTEFDSTRARSSPFTTVIPGRLIRGWNEGLPGMRVGGLRRLIIPSALAYGDRPAGKIPAGATLIFEIELLAVRHPVTP